MIVRIRDLTVEFSGRPILNGLSLEAERGLTLALMGPNGAGKTTLLRCLLGLIRFEGRIEIDGLDIARDGVAARRKIGYVPQAPAFPDLKAGEWLRFVARLRGVPRREVPVVLERIGLERDADRPVKVFSGGMQQRLSLGAALLGAPPILLLDEPTANLDPAGRSDLLRLLREFRKEGKTLLLSSHRAGEVRDLADRVLLLKQGAIEAYGPPAEVIPPDRLELRVEAKPSSEKRRIEGLLRLLDVETLAPVNGAVHAAVESGSVITVVDSLRSDGVDASRIRLRPIEEGDAS
jgi:ABC-type multidrug transport system ATPase subunit